MAFVIDLENPAGIIACSTINFADTRCVTQEAASLRKLAPRIEADFGLSAFAMFFLQSASFLAFQRRLEKGQGRSNCQTLFGIEKIPSDNYIRKMLDMADSALLQSSFERVEQLLAHPALRQSFGRLGGRILVAWDGTEYFRSEKLGCSNCLT